MPAAFFDLDRTLLDCNSARLWLRDELQAGRISWRDAAWAGWWLVRYSLGHAETMDQAFAQAVARLEGIEEAEIEARTIHWFERRVRERLRPGASAVLRRHKAAGDRLVLATSSSIYAARAACDAYGLDDFICTRFEVVDGRFTGRVASSALGRDKAQRVREWAQSQGMDLEQCAFYTDSVTDLALLECVGQPVVVHPDRVLSRIANERGWPVKDWSTSW